MSKLKVFAGFIPWIVFSLFATRTGTGTVATAGFLACVIAVLFIIRDVRRGESPKVLEVTGAIAFAAIAIASLVFRGRTPSSPPTGTHSPHGRWQS